MLSQADSWPLEQCWWWILTQNGLWVPSDIGWLLVQPLCHYYMKVPCRQGIIVDWRDGNWGGVCFSPLEAVRVTWNDMNNVWSGNDPTSGVSCNLKSLLSQVTYSLKPAICQKVKEDYLRGATLLFHFV